MKNKRCQNHKATTTAIKLTLICFFMFATTAHALSPSQVFNKVKSSVVIVKTLDDSGNFIALGSGVILPDGKVGTNCHVVKDGSHFQVGSNKKFVTATLWGGDEEKDICLLQAQGLTGKPIQIGQTRILSVGDPVYAVGAPQGLELSLSDGIVSQLRGGPPPFIQTTAAISHGSSGGGLFNAKGQLVGFTSLYIEGGQNLNFAMPVEWVADIEQGKKAAQGRSEIEWGERAEALESSNNWEELLTWCKQWTQARSDSSWAWFMLGGSYFGLQNYSEAISPLRQSIRIDPNFGNSWGLLGYAYFMQNSYSDAIQAYRQMIQIDPKNVNADVWFYLGGSYFGLKRYPEAISPLRQSVLLDPQKTKAWEILVIAAHLSGDKATAWEALAQLKHIDPDLAVKLNALMIAPQ